MAGGASWEMYALTFGAMVVTYYTITQLRRRRMPPGPIPLPFVGNALGILGRPLHVTFGMLQKKYGDIFSLKVAGTEIVVINGYENIRKALISQGKKFNGRPDITWTNITQRHGIFSIDGMAYHKQKAVVMSILNDVSWDKKEAAEVRIQQNAADLIGWLEDKVGKPVNPQIYLDTAICNVTSEPLMGLKFTPTDDLMIAVSQIAMEIFIDAGAQNVNNYFTFLRNIPGDPTNYKVLMKNATTAVTVITKVIESHKEKFEKNPSDPKVDFIDYYLGMIKAGTDPTCTEQQLIAAVTDLFAMGIEASATTLRWSLLLMCKYPKAQAHIQREISEVIGSNKVALKYLPEMNYTNAVLHEIQRYINLVSINLPHATTEDVCFEGYDIAKGTIVLPNLASIHYDANTYDDPLTFKPDRFLTSEGFQKPEKFMPYSAGTRTCPGRNISQWQQFILLLSLLQRFNIKLDGEVGEDIYGLIRYPGDFKVLFTKRKESLPETNGHSGMQSNGTNGVHQ